MKNLKWWQYFAVGSFIAGIAGVLTKVDLAVLFGFGGTCVTGIAALVRGLSRKPKEPEQLTP